MSLLAKMYTVDEEAALNGKWFTTEAGMRVKVSKLNNPRYKTEVVRLQKPHLARLRSGDIELAEQITNEAMSLAILIDWENEDEDGNQIPYTSELGLEALIGYPDFREDIASIAVTRTNFSAQHVAGK